MKTIKQKHLISLLALFLSMAASRALAQNFEDKVLVDDLAMIAGTSQTMEINLSNDESNLVAFQMDLTLPDGVSLDKSGCSLSSRFTDEDQELTIGKLGENAYRLTSTSLALSPISGKNGALITLKLTAIKGCVGGQAMISNIRFSTSDSKKLNLEDVTFDITSLYLLTYKVDDEVYKTDTIGYGAALTAEAAPTKVGYTFSGWSEIPETMPANDVVVTGTFTINTYKVTYMVDGEEYKTDSIDYGAVLTPETEPTKEGYTFSGWSEIPETMPANDVVVTGSFTVNTYKLTYMVDGEEYKTDSIDYGTVLTPENEPTKEGYTFSGWSEIPETMPAQDVVVTGSFTVNTYKVTYMVDGEEYKTDSIDYGAVLTPENEPTREGYTFSGWSEIPETMPANDVVVTGSFTVNTYQVTFMYGEEVLKVDSVEYGAVIELPESLDSERYTLIEWLDVPEKMPAHDLTTYASYTDGIERSKNENKNEEGIYDLNGRKLSQMQKGINIIRMKDGSTRKVLVK